MKKCIIYLLSAFILSQSAWGRAVCSKEGGVVTLNDNYTMNVVGLTTKGIKTGTYRCEVVLATPGYLSFQREIQCEKLDKSKSIVMGWMIEGLDMFGRKAASVALYNNEQKVFETGCSNKY